MFSNNFFSKKGSRRVSWIVLIHVYMHTVIFNSVYQQCRKIESITREKNLDRVELIFRLKINGNIFGRSLLLVKPTKKLTQIFVMNLEWSYHARLSTHGSKLDRQFLRRNLESAGPSHRVNHKQTDGKKQYEEEVLRRIKASKVDIEGDLTVIKKKQKPFSTPLPGDQRMHKGGIGLLRPLRGQSRNQGQG